MAPQHLPFQGHASTTLSAGQSLKIINTHGTQVVDLWAFTGSTKPMSYLSMAHTRANLMNVSIHPGDKLVTNLREPILTLTEDTTPGIHDTLFAACDPQRYKLLGVQGYHPSCGENLTKGLKRHSDIVDVTQLGGEEAFNGTHPPPLNLFMNIEVEKVTEGGRLSATPPTCKPGQFVVLKADIDAVVVMSACPMDIVPVNGEGEKGVSWEVIG